MHHILKCHEIVKTDFVQGDNCYLYDCGGTLYVDFESGIWCTGLGHNHPRLKQVMRTQIDTLIHLGVRYLTDEVEETAVDVLRIVGFESGKCVFLSSGSEAVEFGVQAAKLVTQKPSLLAFSNSYLAAYGAAGRKDTDQWHLLDWSLCENPDSSECLTDIAFEQVAAFVFEPGGSGSGFVNFPPQQLVEKIAQRVQQAGGLVVTDEITTGMGRTGKWFGFQHYDVRPDVVALGKGLGNGYPVSAVAMKQEVAEALEEAGFHYAQSHQNDPLGCAVAREVISVLTDGDWIRKAAETGAFFLDGLNRLVEKREVVKEARGRGMLLGLELHPHDKVSVESVYYALLDSGFLVGYYPAGNVLRFDPALTMEKDDIARLLDNLDRILRA